MKQKDNNLTQFFTEYLTQRSDRTKELTATNITLACYGALNETNSDLNLAEVIFNMRTDFEYILNVIDTLARDIAKNTSNNSRNHSKSAEDCEYYTIPEATSIYPISQQAIRKACIEKRLPYKEGRGKNKYLIRKADIEIYIAHAKGKHSKAA